MIRMSYSEYDDLLETIDEMKVKKDYVFPTVKEAEELLQDKRTAVDVFFAIEKTEDAEYSKALNELVRNFISFYDDEKEPEETEIDYTDEIKFKVSSLSQKRINAVTRTLTKVGFHPSADFNPTRQDLQQLFEDRHNGLNSVDLRKDDRTLAFLIYLVRRPLEDPSSDIVETARYAKVLIEKNLK